MDRNQPMGVADERVGETESLHANEPFARFLAYTSPYLFWTSVLAISVGLLWM